MQKITMERLFVLMAFTSILPWHEAIYVSRQLRGCKYSEKLPEQSTADA
jgi:hypothetical protein